MQTQINSIAQQTLEKITNATTTKQLDEIRINVLGKKGELTAILRGMGGLSAEERPQVGQLANTAREQIETALNEKISALAQIERQASLQNETIDVTLPGTKTPAANLHPLTQVIDEISDIFLGLGFSVADGPEIEDEYHNFTALNIPPEHPARDEQDTFYFTPEFVLRTATSTMQIRTMEHTTPPLKIIAPGRVYRSDSVDATHSPMFHQIEGLVVDKGITFGDLKGVLELFVKKLYGEDVITRFRPHYFPFTEPSAEMDISCFACGGVGCSVCKGEGWIEILGCGMVHPDVLRACNIDPDEYTGFAFGLGVERVTMRRWGITDLRHFYENDIRFLRNF